MIHVAIIGTGSISRLHIEAYAAFPERCVITALCDSSAENIAGCIRQFPALAGVKTYTSHADLLNERAAGLVSICTPPYTHAAIAVDCLAAGLHVILEKPMAASLQECDAILAAAAQSTGVFSPVAQNRFRDPILNLKRVLDAGLCGKVLHAQVDSFWWRGHSYYDLWWRGTWEKEGGGCTLNHAVHHIDMLGWMLGLPDTLYAMLGNTAHNNAEVEDLSVALMRYNESARTTGGALAQLTCSVVHHGEQQQLIFQTEKARLAAPWNPAAHHAQDNGFPAPAEHSESFLRELNALYASYPPLIYTGHTGQIDNVLAAIETGGKPLIEGTDGRRTIEIITAIYKSGSQGTQTPLPILPADTFYTARGIQEHTPRFYQKTAARHHLEGGITTGSTYTA